MKKTHKYIQRYLGHDYIFNPIDNGMKGHMMGWGDGLNNGDYLILKNGGSDTRYKIDQIKYFQDPKDMWSAQVSFAPR